MKLVRFSVLLCMYFVAMISNVHAQSKIYDYSSLKPIIVAASNASSSEKSSAKYVCDGSSDEDEINRALREGKLVRLTSGDFKIDGTISGGNNILTGAGKGQTKIRMSSGLENAISIGGSQSRISTLGAKVSKGSTTVYASGDVSSKLKSGDKVMVGSKDVFSGDRGYYIKGEVVEVKSVSGNRITTVKPLQDSYTTSKETRIVKYNFRKDVGVADLTVINDGKRAKMVDLHEVDRGFYKNVKVESPKNMAMQGLILSHAVNSIIDGCEAVGIQDNWRNQSGAQGYGYYFFGVEDTELRNSVGYGNKHTVELGGFWWVPVTRRILVSNVTATKDVYSPFSTHGASEDIVWVDCTAKSCGGGFIIRNPKTKVIRPKVYGATLEPFHIGEFTQQGGNWPKWWGRSAEDIYIYDAYVEVANGHPFLDVYDPVKNVKIDGGTWKGAKKQAFLFRGDDCDNLVIENANIDLTGQNSGYYVVEVNPQSGSPTISATFQNSKLCNPAVKSSFVKKTVGGSVNVSNVRIDCALDMVAGDLSSDFDNISSGPTPIEPRNKWQLDAGLETGTATYEGQTFEPMLPYMSGSVHNMPRTLEIENTENDALYATEIYSTSSQSVITLPVDTAAYDVYLHFAEVYFSEAGKRSFHIEIEGKRVVSDLDIVAEAGANTALLKGFKNVDVKDGKLEVTLVNNVQSAKISGIEVLPVGTAPLAVGNINQAPQFGQLGDIQILGGESKTVEVTATDKEGESITLTATDLPDFASLTDAGNGKGTLELAPSVGQEGSYTVVLTATDASNNKRDLSFTINVAELSVWRLDAGLSTGTISYEGKEFKPMLPYVKGNAYDVPRSLAIENTENDPLYSTEIYATSANSTIELPVTNGNYDVHLHFAEVYFTEVGKRSFHVDVEGERKLTSLDILSEVGANTALVKSFENISVTDGKLEVVLTNEVQNSKISGIEVVPHGQAALNAEHAANGPQFTTIEDVQILAGESQTIDVSATDPKGGSVTIEALQLPSFAQFTEGTDGNATVTLAPTAGQEGTATVELQAKDTEGNTSKLNFNVEVKSLSTWRLDAGLTSGTMSYEGKEFMPMLEYMSGTVYDMPRQVEIASTEYDELYATEIYSNSSTATLALPVTNGNYDVYLHFAEVYFTEAGKRSFHVDVEGERVINSLDIVAEAGANTALIKNFSNVEVKDGKLEVVLTNEIQNAKISGIEVVPHGTPALGSGSTDSNPTTDSGSTLELGFAILPVEVIKAGETMTLNLTSTVNGADVQWEVLNEPDFATFVNGTEYSTLTLAPVFGDEGEYQIQVKATNTSTGEESVITYQIQVMGETATLKEANIETLVENTYPNPIISQVTFGLSKALTETVKVDFYDLNGGLLYNTERSLNSENQFSIDLSGLAYEGVLFAKVSGSSFEQETVKLYKSN